MAWLVVTAMLSLLVASAASSSPLQYSVGFQYAELGRVCATITSCTSGLFSLVRFREHRTLPSLICCVTCLALTWITLIVASTIF